VEPMTTAIALQRPMLRASVGGGEDGDCGVVEAIGRSYALPLPAGSVSSDYSCR
jgi:hypothetical protein